MLRLKQKSIWWGLVVVYMATIFILSHQPATDSNALSYSVTNVIVETVEQLTDEPIVSLAELNHMVRKNTHFFAYFGLSLVLWKALILTVQRKLTYGYAWGIATLYACTDEFHQLFVPGRGGQISDVLIDSSGAALAMLFVFSYYKIRKKSSTSL